MTHVKSNLKYDGELPTITADEADKMSVEVFNSLSYLEQVLLKRFYPNVYERCVGRDPNGSGADDN